MSFLNDTINSEKIEEKGQQLYLNAKAGMVVGFWAFVLMNVICCICTALGGNYLDPLLLSIHHSYFWAYFLILPLYIASIWGVICIPMYFNGIIIFALGRIAHNTEKTKSESKADAKKPKENYKKTYKKTIKTVIADNSKKDNSEINFDCPHCGETLYFQKFDLESGKEIICPMCDKTINYK